MDYEIRVRGGTQWQHWGEYENEEEAIEQYAEEYDDESELTNGSVLVVEIRERGTEEFKSFQIYAEVSVNYVSRELK